MNFKICKVAVLSISFSILSCLLQASSHNMPCPKSGHGNRTDSSYRQEVEYYVMDENSFWGEFDQKLIDSDMFLVDSDNHTLSYIVDSGYYTVSAICDTRCVNFGITVFDNDRNILATTTSPWGAPNVSFVVFDNNENITVDLSVDTEKTYIAYDFIYHYGIDTDSRYRHIENVVATISGFDEESGEIVLDSGIGYVNKTNPIASVLLDAPKGYISFIAESDFTVSNLNLAVYDERGVILGKDTYEDSYPLLIFHLKNDQRLRVDIIAEDFAYDVEQSWFGWKFATYSTPGDYGYVMGMNPGFNPFEDLIINSDDELSDLANDKASITLSSLIDGNETVIDTYILPLSLPGEDYGHSFSLNLNNPGTYRFYASGDGECLEDIDMVIYNLRRSEIARDDSPGNSPYCEVSVGSSGLDCELIVYAFTIDCNKGFFSLIITWSD